MLAVTGMLLLLLPGESNLTPPARLPASAATALPAPADAAAAGGVGLVLLPLLVRAKRALRSVVPEAAAAPGEAGATSSDALCVGDTCVGDRTSPASLKRTLVEVLSLRPLDDLEPLPTNILRAGRLGLTAAQHTE
jgi:hypothetical protein